MTAGAVMTWNGAATTGRCVLVATARPVRETCRFVMGTLRMTAADTFDGASRMWRRRYGDGVDVAIAVPLGSALTPIPFPIAR